MNRLIPIACALALAIPAFASAAPFAAAPSMPRQALVTVQSNCNAVGQQIALQNGGTLAKASMEQRGGQTVCVIVVLVPAKDGQRPRREEFVVPQ